MTKMKTYLELGDIKSMERAACCLRDKLLVRLLFRLACRVSEALALTVKDIDFDRATVTIQHLKTRIRVSCPKCNVWLAKRHRFCPQCGEKVSGTTKQQQQRRRLRTLPVDPDTLNMLRDYLVDNQLTSNGNLTRVFTLNRHRAWQIVRDCAERAGLPDLVNPETGKVRGISPHRLRDAFSVYAMKLDDSGDGLRLLQEHLGHTSFNTTAKYRKIAGEEHREWYDSLWNQIT